MHLRIKRRQFGQLAIASATTTVITSLAGKSIAQQTQQIYGISLSSSNVRGTQNQVPSNVLNKQSANVDGTTPAVVLKSLDLATGKESSNEIPSGSVENQNTVVETGKKAILTQSGERLTDVTALSDGTIIIATVVSSVDGDFSRLIFSDKKAAKFNKGLKGSGFKKKNNTIESLLVTKDNKLLSIVSLNAGTPPFDLAEIDIKTGKVSFGEDLGLPELSQKRRFANLAQATDSKIYATSVTSEGTVMLVQLDPNNKAVLTGRGKVIDIVSLNYNKKSLVNDIKSLAFSSTGELFALADPQYDGTNSLFTVDLKTGNLTFVRKFAVDQITF